jgi:small conductance mechanosensitive channel
LQSLAPSSASSPLAPPITFSTDPHLPPLVEEVRRLFSGDDVILRQMANAAGGFAVNLALAGVILAITVWASGVLSRMTARAIARAHRGHHADTTLQSFASSLVRYFVVIIGMVGVLQQLGVRATSVIAVLGAASLAIGLALQGALSNVAAGVMILILRPYRVGDDVSINGKQGVVQGLDLFSTRLHDPDNLLVFVPNSKAWGDIIVNTTETKARRVVIDMVIDRTDDVALARRLLLELARADKRVLPKPLAWANITDITDDGLKVTLRCYAAPSDYGNVLSDLMWAAVQRFRAEGLSLPYPHQVAVETRPFRPPEALAERLAREGEERSFAPKTQAEPDARTAKGAKAPKKGGGEQPPARA